jgi:hypothetical protein
MAFLAMPITLRCITQQYFLCWKINFQKVRAAKVKYFIGLGLCAMFGLYRCRRVRFTIREHRPKVFLISRRPFELPVEQSGLRGKTQPLAHPILCHE